MLVSELKGLLHPKFYEIVSKMGISELREPQEIAINKGLLEGKNLVIASPTSSGKTFVAELAGVENLLRMKGKMIYVAPLKALASEKYKEFEKKYSILGLKVALSIGDLDSYESWIGRYDIIVVTAEKLDSLIRHGAPWLEDVYTVVIDEIHLINDTERGPTLEVLITLLRKLLKKSQIIALSATIKNAKEIAEWLDAELVFSNYRPIPLKKGVYYKSEVHYEEKNEALTEFSKEEVANIVLNCLKEKKQSMVFLSSRRNAESTAEKLSKVISSRLSDEDKEKLSEISRDFLKAITPPTSQCRKNASCIVNGAAFHHAGLVSKQRDLIEENFKKGIIKAICATPTLAWGVNLPSQTVIVRDLKRFDGGGSGWIPVLEVHQMFGRAGRSDYHEEGRALLIAKSDAELKVIQNKYIFGEPEEIYSKLSMEPILRAHVLSLLCGGFADDLFSIMKFISCTFYAKQYGELDEIENKVNSIVDMLADFDFIERKGTKLHPTQLGERVSQLYLDPVTAKHFVDCINSYDGHDDFSLLCAVCYSKEMEPLINIKRGDETEKEVLLFDGFLGFVPSEWDYQYYKFLMSFKTAQVVNDWVKEETEEDILRKYDVSPGILRNKIDNTDWLIYSMRELATLLNKKNILNPLTKLRMRVKYGVKEELLNLLKLKGIGRIRARKLYANGIKTISEVRNADLRFLTGILGSAISKEIKERTEIKREFSE